MIAYDAAELAQTLFEEAGDALFLFDPESENILDTNPMAQRLTGWGRRELLRMQITYLFRSEAQGGMTRLRNAFRKTGLFHSQEGFFLRREREGSWLPVNLTITRLHTELRTLGLITARDMTEQREAQALLKEKETELRRVLSSVSDCLWSAEIHAKGRWELCYCSPVIEKITGHAADYFRARFEDWQGLIHPQDRPRVLAAATRLCQGEASLEDDFRIVRGDGGVRWLRAAVQARRS